MISDARSYPKKLANSVRGHKLLVVNTGIAGEQVQYDRFMVIIDPLTREVLDRVPIGGHHPHEMVASPDGKLAFVSNTSTLPSASDGPVVRPRRSCRLSTLHILSLLVFLTAEIALAQVTTGTISGTVKDSTGAVLPGAQMMILNEETDISRSVEADPRGRYSAPSLSLGSYKVTGTMEGFQTVVRTGIVLTVGREAIVNLELPVGPVTQTVEITGEAPLVESTTASLGSLVDDRTIRALPLDGRSYDQLALLQPGVILTSPGPTGGTRLQYGTGKRLSVGGQRSISNSFLLDGTSINDQGNGTPGGAAGTNLGVDTILEFKIFTNSYKAEYGRSTGGIVTAITRSGTNSLHGTAFEYIRNSALDARNFFDVGSSPPPFKRNQFGGVLGGPIKWDKVFFFGGYEGLRERLATTQIASVSTLQARQGILPTGTVPVNPAVVPYLDLYPLPNGRDFGDGSAEFLSSPTIVTNQDYFMGRVDHQLNANTGIFGRYTLDNDDRNVPQSLPSFFQVTEARRQYTTLQATSILGPKALNHFRFAFNRSYSTDERLVIPDVEPQLAFIPGQPFGAIEIGGGGSIGTRGFTTLGDAGGPSVWAYNVFEWGNDFSYVTGKHSLKAGVDIQRLRDNAVRAQTVKGEYRFSNFNDLLSGRANRFRAATPVGILANWGLRQGLYAVYVQDDYTVNSRINLNLGLRWEATTDPKEVNGKSAILPSTSAPAMVISDRFFSIGKKNFEPRVGLAWQLNASGKTVLRIGGGIYHNQILPWFYQAFVNNPPFFGRVSLSNPPFPDGYQVLPEAPTGALSLSVPAPFNKTPVSNQYSVSIQHEIPGSAVVEVAYRGNKTNHLALHREANTPIPTILPDRGKFFPAGAPRRNPAFGDINFLETDGNSMYNSVTVTLRRQSSTGIQGQIFYAFSKAMDETSSMVASDSVRSPNGLLDPEDHDRDWGLADFDSRHAVIFNLSYPVPFQADSRILGAVANGWTLSGIGTFTAGLPFTARLSSSVSRNGSGVFAERPDLKPGASQNPNQGTSVGCAGFLAGRKLGAADNFYDPCSFSLPQAGTYGNLGRNTIIGPGVANVDLSLGKSFQLREQADITFRAELFNLMNHANFDLPNTSALASGGAASPSAGRIVSTTTSSRQLQFGLRISF